MGRQGTPRNADRAPPAQLLLVVWLGLLGAAAGAAGPCRHVLTEDHGRRLCVEVQQQRRAGRSGATSPLTALARSKSDDDDPVAASGRPRATDDERTLRLVNMVPGPAFGFAQRMDAVALGRAVKEPCASPFEVQPPTLAEVVTGDHGQQGSGASCQLSLLGAVERRAEGTLKAASRWRTAPTGTIAQWAANGTATISNGLLTMTRTQHGSLSLQLGGQRGAALHLNESARATSPNLCMIDFDGQFGLHGKGNTAFTFISASQAQLVSGRAFVAPDGSAVLQTRQRLIGAPNGGAPLPRALSGVVVELFFRLPPLVADMEVRAILHPGGDTPMLFTGDGRQEFGGLRLGWSTALFGTFQYSSGNPREQGVVDRTNSVNIGAADMRNNLWLALEAPDTKRGLATVALGPTHNVTNQQLSEWKWQVADWQGKFGGCSKAGAIPMMITGRSVEMGWWVRLTDPLVPTAPAAQKLFDWLRAGGNQSQASQLPQSGAQSTVSVFVDDTPVAAGSAPSLGTNGPPDTGGEWVAINASVVRTSAGSQMLATKGSAAVLAAVSVPNISTLVATVSLQVLGNCTKATLDIRPLASETWSSVTVLRKATTTVTHLSQISGLSPAVSAVVVRLRLDAISGCSGATLSALITELSVAAPKPAAPVLISPRPHQRATDVAVHYSFRAVEGASQYTLEVCHTVSCTGGSILHYHITSTERIIGFFPGLNASHPLEYKLLPAGEYYWRVRASAPSGEHGGWATITAPFAVNDDHSVTSTPIREVSPANPLIHITCWLGKQAAAISNFANTLPRDLSNLTAIVFSDRNHSAMDLVDFVKPSINAGININIAAVNGPGHPPGEWESLTDIEYIFQTMPNVHGTRQGELMWSFFGGSSGKQAYEMALITLCAKYGRYCVWGDGDAEAWQWQRLMADPWWASFLRRKKPFVVLQPKNNIFPGFYAAQSAVYGAFLSGMIGNLGAWDEAWYWTSAGFGQMNETFAPNHGIIRLEPGIFRQLYFLLALVQGSTVYSLDGQSSTTVNSDPDRPAVWYRNGTATVVLERFIAPFFRAVRQQRLIPTREEVLAATRLAVSVPNATSAIGTAQGGPGKYPSAKYGIYQALYSGTYGFRPPELGSEASEILPNNGRFGIVPVLPYPETTLASASVYNLSTLQNASDVRALFESAYPARGASGDSLVLFSGHPTQVFACMSPFENWNVSTTYSIGGPPLFAAVGEEVGGLAVNGIRGTNRVQSYVIGRVSQSKGSLWLQMNSQQAYDTTVLAIKFSARPAPPVVVPSGAAIAVRWIESLHEMQIEVSHAQGAVEVTVGASYGR